MEAAIEDIRQNYAGLYGVEELSEQGKGQLAGSPAAGRVGLGGKAAQQLCGGGAGLAPG